MSSRVLLIVLGSVLRAVAGLVVLTGVVLAAVFGHGDALATGTHSVSTPTQALMSSVARIYGLRAVPSVLGQPRMEVEATVRSAGHGVFVGFARAADAERYLAGADVDVVTDVDITPFRLTTRHQPGTAVVPAPGAQGFWVARAEARSGTARVSWPIQDGDYRLVLMNADGSAAVDVDGRFAVVLPSALRISLMMLAGGLGLAVLAWLALTLGRSAPRSADRQRPSTGALPAGAAPPLVHAPPQRDPRPPAPAATDSARAADVPTAATPERSQN